MTLAVQGPQGLDDLQSLVADAFASLPSYGRSPAPRASDEYDRLGRPFEGMERGYATLLAPVRESRSLSLTWCLPVSDANEWLRCKPDAILFLLLGQRGQGGLNKYLKEQGLANSVDGNIEEFTRTFILISCYFELTPKGLSEWRSVADAFFSYLESLRLSGVPPHVYREARHMRQLAFEYAEPVSPQSFVQSAAGSMTNFDSEHWLDGPSLISSGTEALVPSLLGAMKPSSVIVRLTGPEMIAQATQTEPFYSARYGTLSIATELERWEHPPRLTIFCPPRPNPFIPTRLAIKAGPPAASGSKMEVGPSPTLLLRAPGLRLHHLQDRIFNRPKACAFIELRSPDLYTDASTSACAELYQLLLADALTDVAYEASLGGLSAGAGVSWRGLSLSLSGFDQFLPQLASTVGASLRSFDIPKQAFERRRDQLCRQLRNLAQRQPVVLCAYHRNLALETPRFSNELLLEEAQKATLQDVIALQGRLLPQVEMEALVCGNVEAREAEALVRRLQASLPAQPLPSSRTPLRRVRKLPVGRTLQQFTASNPQEENAAIEVYFQIGPDTGDDWVLLTLLSQMMAKAFYAELRTRQQLGYIVQCNANEMQGVRGLTFLVQGKKQPPPEVEKRIEDFFRLFRGTLLSLPDEDLRRYCDSLAAQFASVDSRLDSQAGRLWQECSIQRYDFQRPWANARKVQGLTREQLLGFFDRYVAAGGSSRRCLSTHVFPGGAAGDQLSVQSVPDEYWPPMLDRLERIA